MSSPSSNQWSSSRLGHHHRPRRMFTAGAKKRPRPRLSSLDSALSSHESSSSSDDLTRLRSIDLRLSVAFKPEYHSPGSPLRPLPLRPPMVVVPLSEEGQRALLSAVEPEPSSATRNLQSPGPQTEEWLANLFGGDDDPVELGLRALTSFASDFDQSCLFLRDELHFLHTTSSKLAPMSRQAAEHCLVRAERLRRTWQSEHQVLSEVLTQYREDRARLQEISTEGSYGELKRVAASQENELLATIEERDEMRKIMAQLRETLADMQRETVELRGSHPAKASGVDRQLKMLSKWMKRMERLSNLNRMRVNADGRLSPLSPELDSEGNPVSNGSDLSRGGSPTSFFTGDDRSDGDEAFSESGRQRRRGKGDRRRGKSKRELEVVSPSDVVGRARQALAGMDEYEQAAATAALVGGMDQSALRDMVSNMGEAERNQMLQALSSSLEDNVMGDAVGAMLKGMDIGDQTRMLDDMLKNMSSSDRASMLRNLIEGSDLDAAARSELLEALLAQMSDEEKAKLLAMLQAQLEGTEIGAMSAVALAAALCEHVEAEAQTDISVPADSISFSVSADGSVAVRKAKRSGKRGKNAGAKHGTLNPDGSPRRRGQRPKAIDGVMAPLWQKGPLPWDKYLRGPKKNQRVRKMEFGLVDGTLIGDVYMKKIMADRDLSGTGKRPTLASSVMHYFTQKYGLKKMAEEFIFGLVGAMRDFNPHSNRILTFAMICGVVNTQYYTPIICDVCMEALAGVFKPEQVAAMYSYRENHTYCKTFDAKKAVSRIFPSMEREAATPAGMRTPKVPLTPSSEHGGGVISDTVQRSWTMPSHMRAHLLEDIDAISSPVTSLRDSEGKPIKKTNAGSGSVQVCDCDVFLKKVLDTFILKMTLDRIMLMDLFIKFDADGNGVLSYDEFTDLITSCQPDPPLPPSHVMEIWDEVNSSEDDDDDDSITKEGFAAVCISRAIQLPYWKLDTDGRITRLSKQLLNGTFEEEGIADPQNSGATLAKVIEGSVDDDPPPQLDHPPATAPPAQPHGQSRPITEP